MLIAKHPRAQIVAGIALILAGILTITLIYKTFNGDFGDNVSVSASVGVAGDSLETGDIVTYRDVIVGEVTSFDATGKGGARLHLRLSGSDAGDVPESVTAIAVPASLFGATEIQLLPGKDLTGTTLHDGSVIAPDKTPGAEGLQTALSDLYTLLTSVRPAELDAALTALASALDGRGDEIGQLIDQADAYLKTLAPSIPDLEKAIRSLATVTNEVADNSPALLASLSNALTPAAGIVKEQASVRELLGVAPIAADNATTLLNNIGDDLVTVVTNAKPVLQALAENPAGLADSVTGFKNVGDALNQVFHGGRASLNVVVTDANAAALVPVLLNQKTHIVDVLANPKPYTAADCPRYPGAVGPNCGAGASTQSGRAVVLTSGQHAVGRMGGAGSSAEIRTVRTVITSLTGIAPAHVPGAMDLVLGPLLRGTTTVLK